MCAETVGDDLCNTIGECCNEDGSSVNAGDLPGQVTVWTAI